MVIEGRRRGGPGARGAVWTEVRALTCPPSSLQMLTMADECTREDLAIDVVRRLGSESVGDRRAELFIERGMHVVHPIRSDNGSEFAAKCYQDWLDRLGVTTRSSDGHGGRLFGIVKSCSARAEVSTQPGRLQLPLRLKTGNP